MREIPIEISRVFSFKEKLQQLKGCDPDSDAIRDGSIGSCFTVKLSKRSNQDISRIVFRNFYTAKLRVEQQTPARTIVLLDDYTLMKDPNYEDDAQDWHIIHVDKNKLDLLALETLDFYLYQPSTLWAKYELQHLKFFEIDPNDPPSPLKQKSLTSCQSSTYDFAQQKSPQSPLKSRTNLSSSSPPSITTSRVQNNRETHLRIHHARSCLDLLVKLRQQIHSQEF